MNKQTDIVTHLQEIQVIKAALPQWTDIETHNIQFQRLSGFTNITYRIIDLQGKRQPLIFKRFSKVQGLLDRQYQNRILIQGSEKGIGPKCYFADQSYRIEEDIKMKGATHPSNQELQQTQLVETIVQKIAQFHQLKLDAISTMRRFCEQILSSDYIQKAKKVISTKEFTTQQNIIVDKITSYFEENALQNLRNVFLPKQQNMVRLCHNDLNNLNIMITNEKQIYLIDYQYSRYNHIAYDLANFISQSSINYTKQSDPFFEFINENLPTKKTFEWIAQVYLKQSNHSLQIDPQLKGKLASDIQRCFGLCNFYWAVWSPMTKNPQIFFNHIEHGRQRLQRFQAVLNRLNSEQN